MNRKQSHEPLGSYAQTQNHKIQYQVTSPYIELLESKKKNYGYRYDMKNNRSFNNYAKPSPASISSIFAQGPKPFKSVSTQKVKVMRTTSTNDKKKRTRTEQAQQKMHESMCVYPTIPDKLNDDVVSKSLYYNDTKQVDFQPNAYFQQLSGQKNKRKRHLSENKHNHSDSNNNLLGIGALQNLQISDIDGLINLIDNCVSQANQYISYLSQKLSAVKEQLMLSKAQIAEMQQQIYSKDMQIVERDHLIHELEKQLRNKNASQSKQRGKQNGFQVKNLLQIIQKISEENQKLRSELEQLKNVGTNKTNFDVEKTNEKQKDPSRDYYNQIHSKIDILNISIDNNHTFNHNNENSDGKDKRDKDASKKYKFIKPKVGR